MYFFFFCEAVITSESRVSDFIAKYGHVCSKGFKAGHGLFLQVVCCYMLSWVVLASCVVILSFVTQWTILINATNSFIQSDMVKSRYSFTFCCIKIPQILHTQRCLDSLEIFIFVLSLEFTLSLLNPLPHSSVCYINNENNNCDIRQSKNEDVTNRKVRLR